jgi:hypothetical protein
MNGTERQMPFIPVLGAGFTIVAGSGSNTNGNELAMPPVSSAYVMVDNMMQVELYNASATYPVNVAFGATQPTANASNGYIVPPGQRRVISIPNNLLFTAAYGIGGAATVYLIPGIGQ